ncbi:MAG: TIGR03087 family PEP-CTERM/XrtA system glycosyltransferase [Sphingomonas sp.]|jgi:sugar transferase (PEP-CTERM/EpsH1 system associated)
MTGDILFLAHRLPFPPDRGDKIRSFNMLKALANHAPVHLAAFFDDPRDARHREALAPYTSSRSIIWRGKSSKLAAAQALLSARPVSLAAFDNAEMRAAVARILAEHPVETIVVYSSQMAQYLPAGAGRRVIMDFVDVDSAKFAAYAENARGPTRWMMQREARLLLEHDLTVAARADASLFVSEEEAALFRAKSGAGRIFAIENGIDTVFFDPEAVFAVVEEPGPLIVFTGQMDYRPNIEAVVWFTDEVLPQVRHCFPKARFAIVGRNPAGQVQALAQRAGVVVTGEVADVRGWLAAAALVVAPLRLARGVQNKVLEAMAMARPVVVSSAAAQGIDHGGAICVGDSAAEMAAAARALIDDPAGGAMLGKAARAQVVARYGWTARLAPLDDLLRAPTVGGGGGGRR